MVAFPNVGNDLIRIHKVITRALDVSLQHSLDGGLDENHRPGFISYVHALAILLHAHHDGEDELSFPYWRIRFPDGQFDDLTEHHRQMITHLEKIDRWIESGSDAWHASSMRQLHYTLVDLQALWDVHIALEEATIGPENARKYLTLSENAELSGKLAAHGQSHAQPGELVMPFMFYNLPEAERDEFAKLFPPVLSQQLVPITWKAIWEPMKPFLLPV